MKRNPTGQEEARASILADMLGDQALINPLLRGEIQASSEKLLADKQKLERLKYRDWLFV